MSVFVNLRSTLTKPEVIVIRDIYSFNLYLNPVIPLGKAFVFEKNKHKERTQ